MSTLLNVFSCSGAIPKGGCVCVREIQNSPSPGLYPSGQRFTKSDIKQSGRFTIYYFLNQNKFFSDFLNIEETSSNYHKLRKVKKKIPSETIHSIKINLTFRGFLNFPSRRASKSSVSSSHFRIQIKESNSHPSTFKIILLNSLFQVALNSSMLSNIAHQQYFEASPSVS